MFIASLTACGQSLQSLLQVPGVNAIIDDGTAATNALASDGHDSEPFEWY